MKLTPYVLWGEHRTTELLAMNIYEILNNDPEIKIKLIEYKQYQLSDYVSVLKTLHKAELREEDTKALSRKLTSQAIDYEKKLKGIYGPFMFNLHDSDKDKYHQWDISFRISKFIKEQDLLKDYLLNKAEKHNIKLKVSLLKTINGDNIVTEFWRPKSIPFSYPSKEIEELDKKYNNLSD